MCPFLTRRDRILFFSKLHLRSFRYRLSYETFGRTYTTYVIQLFPKKRPPVSNPLVRVSNTIFGTTVLRKHNFGRDRDFLLVNLVALRLVLVYPTLI